MKNRQGLTIAALIVAIVGLSIGFAAFSNTLNISSSASVNPSENTFNVAFSRSSNSISTTSLQPTLNAAATSANISTTSAVDETAVVVSSSPSGSSSSTVAPTYMVNAQGVITGYNGTITYIPVS